MNPEGRDFSPAEESSLTPPTGSTASPAPLSRRGGRGARGEGVTLVGGGVETPPFQGALVTLSYATKHYFANPRNS
jgi:hypothetical protein